jgi:hypothetical protein
MKANEYSRSSVLCPTPNPTIPLILDRQQRMSSLAGVWGRMVLPRALSMIYKGY